MTMKHVHDTHTSKDSLPPSLPASCPVLSCPGGREMARRRLGSAEQPEPLTLSERQPKPGENGCGNQRVCCAAAPGKRLTRWVVFTVMNYLCVGRHARLYPYTVPSSITIVHTVVKTVHWTHAGSLPFCGCRGRGCPRMPGAINYTTRHRDAGKTLLAE